MTKRQGRCWRRRPTWTAELWALSSGRRRSLRPVAVDRRPAALAVPDAGQAQDNADGTRGQPPAGVVGGQSGAHGEQHEEGNRPQRCTCLLYTSDAADEEDSVDLGGRRIIKKKTKKQNKT